MAVRTKLVDRDLGWSALFKRLREIKESRVKVGVLADTPQGGARENGGLTVAEIATVLEFGTQDGRIPARPAFRSTFEEQRESLVELGGKLMKGVIEGKIDVTRALNIMGSTLATAVKKKITVGAGVPPPNAPSTVKRKGSARTWVDTGRVLGAITWAVITGKGEPNDE